MAAVIALHTWLRLTFWHVLMMTLKFVCFLPRVLFFFIESFVLHAISCKFLQRNADGCRIHIYLF